MPKFNVQNVHLGRKKQTEIEELGSRDQNLFWKEIGKIGVGQDRRNEIPMEVKLSSGEISNNTQEVLSVWKNGFETLLNGQANAVSNTRASVLQHADSYDENDPASEILNSDIRDFELKAAIKQMKLKKATALDGLPAEVLKCERLSKVLLKLFNKCFTIGFIPDTWKKGIINPIPKSSTADRRGPLNYRGITLTSSVYKLYCNISNERLSKWENTNNIILYNQNGFRKMWKWWTNTFILGYY